MQSGDFLRVTGVDKLIEDRLTRKGFPREACAPCAVFEVTRIAHDNLVGRLAVDLVRLVDDAIGIGTLTWSSYWKKKEWKLKGAHVRQALDQLTGGAAG